MNTHADKTQDSKSQSTANGLSQLSVDSESTFQFVDNRPETVKQRKLQEMANNSQQTHRGVQPMAQLKPKSLLNDKQKLDTETDVVGVSAMTTGAQSRSIQLKSLPHNANIGSSNCPIQRVLIGADQFHSAEEVSQSGDKDSYLDLYAEIREEVRQYNLAEGEIEIISRLNKLDILQGKVTQCLELIPKDKLVEQSPASQRKGHLDLLKDSIVKEKAKIISEKTDNKDVLPGREGTLRVGMSWELKQGEDDWIDASEVLKEQQTLTINIIDSANDKYIFEFQLKDRMIGRIAKQQLELKSKFTADNSALYPTGGKPVKEDVQQTNLGDCYLQAALAGLAASNPDFIKEMLYDEGDHVVVRLFRLPKKTVEYIRVQRSKAQTQEGLDLYNDGAIWVKMIQKAYAAGNFAMDQQKSRKRGALVDIAGEMVGYTMGVLTGREVESYDANGENMQLNVKDTTKFPWDSDVATLSLFLENGRTPKENDMGFAEYHAALNLLNPLFQNNAGQIKIWAKFADEYHSDLDTFKSIDDLNSFFTENNLDEGIMNLIMKWVRESGFYHGVVGSGVYSNGQLAVLDKIVTALENHKLLTVGSQKELPQDEDQEVGGSGEPKYKGLAGGHAYTILSVRKNRTQNPDSDDKGNIHWIQLRNPWGHYGRSYNEDWSPVAIEEGNGVFWIELTDMAKNFKNVEII